MGRQQQRAATEDEKTGLAQIDGETIHGDTQVLLQLHHLFLSQRRFLHVQVKLIDDTHHDAGQGQDNENLDQAEGLFAQGSHRQRLKATRVTGRAGALRASTRTSTRVSLGRS